MPILILTTINMTRALMTKISILVVTTKTLAMINTTKIKDLTKQTTLTTTEMTTKPTMNMPITTTMDTIIAIRGMIIPLNSNSSSITTIRTQRQPNMTSSSMMSIQKQNLNTTSLIRAKLIPRNK